MPASATVSLARTVRARQPTPPASPASRFRQPRAGSQLRDAAIQVLLLALCPERTPLQVAVELEHQLFEDYREPGGWAPLLFDGAAPWARMAGQHGRGPGEQRRPACNCCGQQAAALSAHPPTRLG